MSVHILYDLYQHKAVSFDFDEIVKRKERRLFQQILPSLEILKELLMCRALHDKGAHSGGFLSGHKVLLDLSMLLQPLDVQ